MLTSSAKKIAEAINSNNEQGQKFAIMEVHKQLIIQVEHMNMERQLLKFYKRHATYPMYNCARMYLHQGLALLSFHCSVKQPQRFLYLALIENLATY